MNATSRHFTLVALLFTLVLPVTGKAQGESRAVGDEVYILDVSTSMFGAGNVQDIMPQVIRYLSNEIQQLDTATTHSVTFLLFANQAPFPLDPQVPGLVTFPVNSPSDLNNVRCFLDPNYDPRGCVFHDLSTGRSYPDWPGVDEATRLHGGDRTSICGTFNLVHKQVLPALKSDFDKLGDQTGYWQRVHLITDGRENVSLLGDLCFSEIRQKLKEQNAFLNGHYLIEELLIGIGEKPNLCQNNPIPNCETVPIARPENGTSLLVFDLKTELSSLRSPDNLFSVLAGETDGGAELRIPFPRFRVSTDVDLANVEIEYSINLSLPEGVGQPTLSLTQTQADQLLIDPPDSLTLTFTDVNRDLLARALRDVGDQEFSGMLHMRAIYRGAKATDDRSDEVDMLLTLEFARPTLNVTTARIGSNQIRIEIDPDDSWIGLPEQQRQLQIQVFPSQYLFSLRDTEGNDVNRFSTISHTPLSLVATFEGDFPCDQVIPLELRVSTEAPVFLNDEIRADLSYSYQLQRVTFQPPTIVSGNLWSANLDLTSDVPQDQSVSVQTCSGAGGSLRVFTEEAEIPAQLTITPGQIALERAGVQTTQLRLEVTPQTSWKDVGAFIGEQEQAVPIRLSFESKEPTLLTLLSEAPHILLNYRPTYVSLQIAKLASAEPVPPNAAVYRLVITAVGIDDAADLLSIQADGAWQIRPDAGSEWQFLKNAPRLRTGTYELRMKGLGGVLVGRVTCSSPLGEGRWYRGQTVLICHPVVQLTPTAQEGIFEFSSVQPLYVEDRQEMVVDGVYKLPYQFSSGGIVENIQNLSVRVDCKEDLLISTDVKVQSCGEAIPFQEFDVVIAEGAPAGTGITDDMRELRVEIRDTAQQATLSPEVSVPKTRGFLLPQAYDRFWEAALFWLAAGAFWLLVLCGIGVVLYAWIGMSLNPIEYVVNYIFLDERWRFVALLLIGLVIVLWGVQSLISWRIVESFKF